MPATDSEFTPMEDSHALRDEEGSSASAPSSVPAATVPPPAPAAMRPNFTSEAVIETKAVSVASNDCGAARGSPAEASPAKAAVTSPTTFDGTVGASPATSHIASASDSLACTGMSIINISESPPTLPVLPSTTFGSADLETDYPTVLTFKGVSVSLENNSVWKQFNGCGTEMILTKQGRRMFPYCRYRLSGLNPDRQYSLVLSIVPSDPYRYRWSTSKWEVNGPAEHQAQSLIRAFSHHYSPCRGSEWMGGLVSFYKLKLTNNPQDQEGHIILHSMHRYIPRLHVIPVPEGDAPSADKPVVMGPECMTFTFPQTEFMAVTTYQNFRITQLKINHNPFAKGFREDGNNPRLNRVSTHPQPMMITETQPAASEPAEPSDNKEGIVNLSTKNHAVSASPSNKQTTRLVLKPIMSTSAGKDEPYVPCIRGKHALGELVLVQKSPSEESPAVSVTPKAQQGLRETPKSAPATPASTPSTPGSSPGYRKRRKRINRHWANSRGKEWKAATASPTVVYSPSLTVAMQPELDDVEGLLFVSFTSKEALEVHLRDKPANNSPSPSPVSPVTQMRLNETVELIPETDEEKIVRLETTLLQDLQVLKHRQSIHPVLQEVGMKLSSLDSTRSIDLQYLGIRLPLPPPNLPERGGATSPVDEELPFISRTGKTSDMTKIKGWKNKFIRRKETSLSNCDGSQKNLSAFCSNMLDEYLESEGRYISERADAFSTNPEGSVAYQLPAKSSSYVKTLDSALKHRSVASKSPTGANRPCPLSYKPLLYSALTSPAPPLASAETPVQTGAQSRTQQPQAAMMANAASESNSTSSVSQRSSPYHPVDGQRLAVSFNQSQRATHRPSGLTKFQLKLWQMENGAAHEGLSRTQLTSERLSVALSVLLTKQMMSSQILKVAQYAKPKDEGPACGQDFCRLGCVCSSLQQQNSGPLHCRQTECMFGCACFKHKITKQGETDPQIQDTYSMTNMEHVVQPRPGSHANKLWNRNIHDVDPEPLFAPKSAPQSSVPSKVAKSSSSIYRPVQQQIQEEDKDPVYKLLESMMTCARVREFTNNSKPPPEVTVEAEISDPSKHNATAKPQKTTAHDEPKMYYRTVVTTKKTEQTSQGTAAGEAEARKQIEIQSACQWDKDRKKVLETLCRRMNQNRLSKRFYIGPYRICPVAKIFMRKPSGSIVTYRLHISKPSKVSDDDDEELDDSDEEKFADRSFEGNTDAEEECGQTEEPEMQIGVTPFLSGVLPAGRLRARTKPVGCQAHGLIQVNGKSYNQARLLLGNMGSLHPANRLASYVTGRLHVPADLSLKEISQKSDPAKKTDAPPGTLHIKAGSTVVPPVISARKTTELKSPAQPPAQLPQPEAWRNGSISMQRLLQNSSTINPAQAFFFSQLSSVSPFQSSSTSSPVSLTVSQSLKTPSFLGQSGTYSFRICPPANNQGAGAQNLPGVALPGGFTLIQLPKPGGDGAQKSESVNNTNTAGVNKAPPPKDALFDFARLAANPGANWPGFKALAAAKALLSSKSVQPGSSTELMCEEKIPSDESDEANTRKAASNPDVASEHSDSDSSDYCGEGDEDEGLVDIESIEEEGQGMAIAMMKEAARKALQESRYSADDLGSARELDIKDNIDEELARLDQIRNKDRRKNHTALERRRRTEQRTLFNKLHIVLQTEPKPPRLGLLSLALKEIQNLVEKSKHLEETKRRLTQMHSAYVKELSLLSGKSDQLIRCKVKEICDRQKMREKRMNWRPFFSNLLRSKAALLQATSLQSNTHHVPLLKPYLFTSSSQASPDTTVDQTPKPTPPTLPLAVSSLAQDGVTAHPVLAENRPGEPEAPAQVGVSNPQSACQLQVVSVGAQDGPSSISSTSNSNNPSACTAQPLTLPLIRSKTGRIILPSSLKPLGQGFYTLMVMKPKGEDGEDITQPSVVSKSDHPSHSENPSPTLAEDKSVQSPNSEPKHSGVKPPLAELALLNKSIFVPSMAAQAVEKSQESSTPVRVHKTVAAALSYKRSAHTTPPSAEPESKPSPSIVRRPRGRPRKNPVSPVSIMRRRYSTTAEDTGKSASESETSVVVEKRQCRKMRVKVKREAEVVSDDPVPVKRARGRPPKSKSAAGLRTPSITRRDRSFQSPDAKSKKSLPAHVNTSRPLTRGALGKDFPSAKKRSWIDMEKELEPELEFEPELESESELESE